MKKRLILLTAFYAFVVLTGLCVLSGCRVMENAGMISAAVYTDYTKPNDPPSRAIRKAGAGWGIAAHLVPQPFELWAPEADVISELQRANYKPDPERIFSRRYPKAFPADSQFYEKTVGGLPCAIHYEVVVRFDAQHHLLEGWGTYDEAGCL